MKTFFSIVTWLMLAVSVCAQDYAVTIPVSSAGDLARLSRAVSIDNIRDGIITAYANEGELITLRTILPQYAYRVRRLGLSKSSESFDMASDVTSMQDWAHYPTYDTYVEMMHNFADQYPDIATLVDIGASAEGRQILALRIAAQGDTTLRPRVLLTSTMHGDEVCGFVLMLRLIDYLLSNYSSDATATRIIDNIVLYINPLSNPDGTYHGGNNTVSDARRYNGNNVDLNRNFPQLGALSKSTQNLEPETIAMMNFAKSRHFALSANMHSGDEVLNYPWDSFYETEMSLADKDWFVDISKKYIDTLRTFAPNGMKSVNNEGYVFGSEWYKVVGGRQDWMLFSERCREITIELSRVKLLSNDQLDDYWQRNRDALLMYISNALQGIRGRVEDVAGNPIEAHIYLDGHDANYSSIYCDQKGVYVRPTLADQTYNVCAVAEGFATECKTVNTLKNELVTLDFMMTEGISEYTATSEHAALQAPVVSLVDGNISIQSARKIDRVIISDIVGRQIASHEPKANAFVCPAYNFTDGTYVIIIYSDGIQTSSKITITK
ncbi:MAG: DUF2817 domain-containing protein [Bacteroidales bacterium]|nr:DUF2817 domain-containing protein [Bacteroidales bacterium]